MGLELSRRLASHEEKENLLAKQDTVPRKHRITAKDEHNGERLKQQLQNVTQLWRKRHLLNIVRMQIGASKTWKTIF